MIPGLRYVPVFLDAGEHDALLTAVDTGQWRDVGARRMQFTDTATTSARAVHIPWKICRRGHRQSLRASFATA